MSSFMLSFESTADRTAAFFAEHDIAYSCFHYEVDGKTYLDDLYQSTTSEQFFASIAAGAQPKTSQVGTGEYIDFWEPSLKEGKDVLHVSLSSAFLERITLPVWQPSNCVSATPSVVFA